MQGVMDENIQDGRTCLKEDFKTDAPETFKWVTVDCFYMA